MQAQSLGHSSKRRHIARKTPPQPTSSRSTTGDTGRATPIRSTKSSVKPGKSTKVLTMRASSEQSSNIEQLCSQACEQIRTHQHSRAVSLLSDVLKENPDHIEGNFLYSIGASLAPSEKFTASPRFREKRAARRSELAGLSAYLTGAEQGRLRGDIARMKKNFDRAFDIAPLDPMLLFQYARCLFRTGNTDGARAFLKMIEERHHKILLAKITRRTLLKDREYVKAFFLLRGQVYLAQGPENAFNAYRDFKKVLAISKNNNEANTGLRQALALQKSLHRASKDAITHGSNNYENGTPTMPTNGHATNTSISEGSIRHLPKPIQHAIKAHKHAGIFIRETYFDNTTVARQHVADAIHIHLNTLSSLLLGKADLSAEMATKLAWYFPDFTADQLMDIQKFYDLHKATIAILPRLQQTAEPEMTPG